MISQAHHKQALRQQFGSIISMEAALDTYSMNFCAMVLGNGMDDLRVKLQMLYEGFLPEYIYQN